MRPLRRRPATLPRAVWAGFTLIAFVPAAHGESGANIVVTAPLLERTLYETPAALSVVDRPTIQQGQLRNKLDESLVLVPGVYLQNQENYAQGERIAIRGFGARAPLGFGESP